MNGLLKKYNSLSISAKAGIWFVVCSCIQSGIKFLALPIFANIMTVSDYGTVTLYTSWMNVIFIFATLCLGRANGVFYVAMVRFPKDKDKFTSAMGGLTVFLCILCFIVIGLSTFIFGDWMEIGIPQYFAMCIDIIGYGIMLLWSLRMRYDYSYRPLLLMTIAYSIGTVIIPVIGVLHCPKGISPASMEIWCVSITSFVIGITALLLLMKRYFKLFSFKYWKFAISFNLMLIPHYLSNVILVQSDRIMIARMISEAAAAIYNVAYTLGVATQVITQALINAINPWMYKRMNEGRGNTVGKAIISLVLIVAILVIGISLVMPEVFDIFFPESYSPALNVIPPVSAGVLWAFIFNLYASIELYFSGNKLVSLSSCTGALINVIANYILIPVFGFIAAAYTTLACDIINALMHTIFSTILLKKNMPDVDVIPILPVWSIAIFTTVACLLILMLYPYPLARYTIVVIIIVICLIKRDSIKKILNFKSMV